MSYRKWSQQPCPGLRRVAVILLAAGCCGLGTGCQNHPDTLPHGTPAQVQPTLPPGFAPDIPLMPGLSLIGTPQSDPGRGTGEATFRTTATRPQIVAFFDHAMKYEEWSADETRESDGQWLMSFTKGRLKATFTIVPKDASCFVTILYETQQ